MSETRRRPPTREAVNRPQMDISLGRLRKRIRRKSTSGQLGPYSECRLQFMTGALSWLTVQFLGSTSHFEILRSYSLSLASGMALRTLTPRRVGLFVWEALTGLARNSPFFLECPGSYARMAGPVQHHLGIYLRCAFFPVGF